MINFQSPSSFSTLKFNSFAATESVWLSHTGRKGRTYSLLTEQSYACCYVILKGTLQGKKGFKTRKKMCIWISITCHQPQINQQPKNYQQREQYQVSYSAILHPHKTPE